MLHTRLLIIDDDAGFRSLLRMRLEHTGYAVGTATNGWEGLTKLGQADVDVVLLDYQMPGISGLAALEQIRRNFPSVPVIMMTASESEVATRALTAGARACLSKPFRREDLDGAIQACVGTREPVLSLETPEPTAH